VLSISSGKNMAAIVQALAPLAQTVTVTCAEPLRSLVPEDVEPLVRRLAPGCVVRCVAKPEFALRSAREMAAQGDLVVAAGSVYLAGIARRILAEGEAVGRR
jgi:folylpolyglutamate synthase/dihydropteroate synthase